MIKRAINKKYVIAEIFYGISLVLIFALSATLISNIDWFKNLGLSPLIIGIILGIIYASTLRANLAQVYTKGIIFSTKKLLRIIPFFR